MSTCECELGVAHHKTEKKMETNMYSYIQLKMGTCEGKLGEAHHTRNGQKNQTINILDI